MLYGLSSLNQNPGTSWSIFWTKDRKLYDPLEKILDQNPEAVKSKFWTEVRKLLGVNSGP